MYIITYCIQPQHQDPYKSNCIVMWNICTYTNFIIDALYGTETYMETSIIDDETIAY